MPVFLKTLPLADSDFVKFTAFFVCCLPSLFCSLGGSPLGDDVCLSRPAKGLFCSSRVGKGALIPD